MTSQTHLSEHLSALERRRLKDLENTVRSGLASFLEVGRALQEIRESKLHRESHETFEEYAKERFGIGRAHANRLMEAVVVADNVVEEGLVVKREAQARELSPFTPELQKAIARKIKSEVKPGRLSALEIREKTLQIGREMFSTLEPKDKLAMAKLAQKRQIDRAKSIGREKIRDDCLNHLDKAKKCLVRLADQDSLDLCKTLIESVQAL